MASANQNVEMLADTDAMPADPVISVDSRRAIDISAPGSVFTIFQELATAGDLESIKNAIEARAYGPASASDASLHTKSRILLSLAPLFEENNPHPDKDCAKEALEKLLAHFGKDQVGAYVLTSMITKSMSAPDFLRTLVDCGVDPLYEVVESGKRMSPLTALFDRGRGNPSFREDVAPEMFRSLFGSSPMGSLAPYEGAQFMSSVISKYPFSVYELAACNEFYNVGRYFHSRVPSGNTEVWNAMGDNVLRLLHIQIVDGVAISQSMDNLQRADQLIETANALISEGATMRDGKVAWKAIGEHKCSALRNWNGFFEAASSDRFMRNGEDRRRLISSYIDNGAIKIDQRSHNGDTALMLAARKNDIDMVEYLVARNANVNVKCNGSEKVPLTAVDYACDPAHQVDESIRVLLRAAQAKSIFGNVRKKSIANQKTQKTTTKQGSAP